MVLSKASALGTVQETSTAEAAVGMGRTKRDYGSIFPVFHTEIRSKYMEWICEKPNENYPTWGGIKMYQSIILHTPIFKRIKNPTTGTNVFSSPNFIPELRATSNKWWSWINGKILSAAAWSWGVSWDRDDREIHLLNSNLVGGWTNPFGCWTKNRGKTNPPNHPF